MIPVIFLGLVWLISLYCAIKPQTMVDLSAKYFKLINSMFGFETDVKPTPRAVIIVRYWNVFILIAISFMIYMLLTGKLR